MTKNWAVYELNRILQELREAGFIIKTGIGTDSDEEVDTAVSSGKDDNIIRIF